MRYTTNSDECCITRLHENGQTPGDEGFQCKLLAKVVCVVETTADEV